MAGTDLVQALTRGLKILEMAAASTDGVRVPDITEALGIKQPTAHNLARTLVAQGYLVRRAAPVRYALGPAVESLANAGSRRQWREIAERSVRALHEAQPAATVILAEWRAGDVEVSMRLHPSHPDHVEINPAMRLSPHTSASTLCFQAFAPQPEVADFRRRYPYGETATGPWRDADALDAFLAEARRAGAIALSDARLHRVAVPLHNAAGRFAGTLGASYAADAGSADALLRSVVAEAKSLCRHLEQIP